MNSNELIFLQICIKQIYLFFWNCLRKLKSLKHKIEETFSYLSNIDFVVCT